jgi:multidrug efflux pump subunit AcrA (membrane-fusion protein)
MRFKILAAAALLLLVAGALYMLQGKQQQTPKPKIETFKVATAEVASIARTVRLTGQTSARRFANIVAPQLRGPESNKNLVLLELVKAGAFVRKGQVIARIDAQSTEDHIDDVKDTVKQADADVVKRKAEQAIELENLQQTLRQARSDRDKARLDAKPAGILTPIERQLLELNVQETEARYASLEKNLDEQKKSFAAEIRILEITAQRQRRHLERHEHDLVRFTVIAPMDGLAVMQPIWRGGDMGQVEQGDQLGPGQLFAKVVDPKSMQVEARANQVETSDLRIGQHVTVRLDAFPGLQFPGTVYSIGALATGSWLQSYFKREIPVNVTINADDPRLIPDLSASAEVVLQKADDVLAIPLAAVRTVNGRSTVLVRDGDQFVARDVTLGIRNETQVAVSSGLRRGDQVRLD